MPVNLSPPSTLLPVKGVSLATTNAGIRYQGRDDLVLVAMSANCKTGAVYTLNKFCAAPVHVAKAHQANANPRALLINAGNANAGTGEAGIDNALITCASVAKSLNINSDQVLPFSTGVIGEQLPVDKILSVVPDLASRLDEDAWLATAHAIMTTDTVAKGVSKQVELADAKVTITGIAKGSGMIKPDMATMLAYVATDAKLSQSVLDAILKRCADHSFNQITVDGDTSTNDALVLIASGEAGNAEISQAEGAEFDALYQAVLELMQELAQSIVRDAEGATKFVTIEVSGAASDLDCKEVAYTVAHSPLVKTALFASDPNWGRILAAVGRAPIAELDISEVTISIQGDQNEPVLLIEDGEPAPSYSEEQGQAVFNQDEIRFLISLGSNATQATVWTSDLSHDYVSINADYRS
jgi:glutamate N-acetyltransferase/amino-acid N-acetyltransferase